jgi:DNA-binding XRE family transcriptional regulator
LADALDVSRQTVNAIETGKFDPSPPLAFRAARLFAALRIEEIFHDEDRRSLCGRVCEISAVLLNQQDTSFCKLYLTTSSPDLELHSLSTRLYTKTIIEDIMNQLKPPENGYQSRFRKNIIRLVRWNGVWVAATALMAFGPKFLWNKALGFTLLAVGLDVAVGVGMVLATKKYVMELDELQQKVYLNALGIAMGVGLIVGIPFSVMGTYHVIPFHADFSYMVILMGLTFFVSLLYGTWRYR